MALVTRSSFPPFLPLPTLVVPESLKIIEDDTKGKTFPLAYQEIKTLEAVRALKKAFPSAKLEDEIHNIRVTIEQEYPEVIKKYGGTDFPALWLKCELNPEILDANTNVVKSIIRKVVNNLKEYLLRNGFKVIPEVSSNYIFNIEFSFCLMGKVVDTESILSLKIAVQKYLREMIQQLLEFEEKRQKPIDRTLSPTAIKMYRKPGLGSDLNRHTLARCQAAQIKCLQELEKWNKSLEELKNLASQLCKNEKR